MNITILDKRCRIESDTFDKTFDFTKAEFNGTSIIFEKEVIAIPNIEGDTVVHITATLNGIVENDYDAADTGDVIDTLKEHLQRVDLFFLNNNSGGADIFTSLLQPYTATITATQAGTAPSISSPNNTHVYQWHRVGNLVTMFLRLHFETGGVAVSELVCSIPSEMPVPSQSMVDPTSGQSPEFEGLNSVAILSVGNCNWGDTSTNVGLGYCYIINSGGLSDAIRINHTPQTGIKHYQCVLQYFTE